MVNVDGILEDLREGGHDGAVVVTSPADTGVILVRGGGSTAPTPAGCPTSTRPPGW